MCNECEYCLCPTTHELLVSACCRYPQMGGCWGVGECEYCSAYCLCVLEPMR